MADYNGEDREPLEVLAAEFIERQRGGEHPSIAEYAAQHPELAAEIEELFPTIAAMERLRAHREGSQSGRASLGSVRLERLGDFRILGEIGRGGMGIVYEAFQESLGRHVAVKVLPRQALLDPRQLRRFEREARTAARLHHTNIVPLFGVGQQEGFHYLVMQLIRGVGLDAVLAQLRQLQTRDAPADRPKQEAESPPGARSSAEAERLARLLAEGSLGQVGGAGFAPDRSDPPRPLSDDSPVGGPRPPSSGGLATEEFGSDRETEAIAVSPAEAAPAAPAAAASGACRLGAPYWRSVAAIGMQVADALHYAHAHHTLHRDIKPANLLLDSQGVVWITDFGLAKTLDEDQGSQTGALAGTLRYMAPEQFSGQVDARSDVYSLGLSLYELVALRPAFVDTSRSNLIRKITHEQPVRPRKLNPSVPRDLETIVLKAMAREPGDRYQSAADLARDLQRFLEDRPISARRVSSAERLWRWSRRNPAIAVLAASTVALLILVTFVASVGYVRIREANIEEQRQREKADATSAEEQRQRKKADATSALALDALDNIFQQFAPDRTPSAASLSLVSDAGDEISVPVQPVLSKEAAAMLEHMLVFYDRLAKEGGDDSRLRRKIAEANRRVGDIRQRLGHYQEARAAYLRAIELYRQLARAAGGDAALTLEIARILNELGNVGDLGRMYGAAAQAESGEAYHREALATLQAMPAEASSPRQQYELARTYYFLAKSPPPGPGGPKPGSPPGPDNPKPGSPRAPGGPERGPFAKSPRRDSGFSGGVDRGPRPEPPHGAPGVGPGRFGPSPNDTAHEAPGDRSRRPRKGPGFPMFGVGLPPPMPDWERRVDYLRKAVGLLEGLTAAHPSVPDYRHMLARCYREMPWFGRESESSSDARGKAIAILLKLAEDFPDVPDYRYDLSETYAMPEVPRFFPDAKDQAAQGRWQESLKKTRQSLEKALEISETLVAEHPNVPDYATSQVRIRLALARYVQESDEGRAEENLRKAHEVQSSLVRRYPGTSPHKFMLALIGEWRGRLCLKRGQFAEARSMLEASVALLKELSEKSPEQWHLRGALHGNYTALAEAFRGLKDEQAAAECERQAREVFSGR